MVVTNDIKYVGVNDHQLDLFEGQYIVPNGMAYNSYIILDDKITIMDTVDVNFTDEWLSNIKSVLGEKKPDYLVVQHVEPDHSASISAFVKAYPEAVVISNAKAFEMINNFYKIDFGDKKLVVKDGEELSTGAHTLKFIFAIMVHWPEVMFTYDSKDKVLFSADAFGKFGALDVEEEWDCEARRYYFGIVGKFGMQVQNVLKKTAVLDIETICPLHGPVLKAPLDHYLAQYNTWSSYGVESDGVLIAYTSVYGNTKKAAELLAKELEDLGCPKVALNDLAREDMAECVEDAFRYGKIVLATTTYNGSIFPFMREFIEDLLERNFQSKTVGIIENGSWGPMAAKVIKDKLANCKNIAWTENNVRILSSVSDENIEQIKALAKELM